MPPPQGNTIALLRRWHGGDREALDELVRRNIDWISRRVQQSLGPELRARFETQDLVQDVMLEVLECGPRFDVDSEQLFRALLARIVTNDICDRHRWVHRQRRARARERARLSDTVLKLDPPVDSVTRPSQVLHRDERRAWVRLALDFLEPEDREVLRLRIWESHSYPEIGEMLGLTADAVRMRTKRALARLAVTFEKLLDRSALRALESH
ncbi:MAG: sigma-70 family RNA polymerase sigma factor [Planctomycetota bacterium]